MFQLITIFICWLYDFVYVNWVVELANGTSCSSKYVKVNYRVYGIVVVCQDFHSVKIDGLQWKLCVSFGREENVGSKWKPTANMMSWKIPFRFDNIENHLIGQKPEKWKEYLRLSNESNDTLFEGAVSFCNTKKYNDAGSSQESMPVFSIWTRRS